MQESLSLLDILEEMYHRELLDPASDFFQKFIWLKHGAVGEEECMIWLREELPAGARIYHNIELEYNGKTQVDLLVMADEFWWVIEVKNYRGIFKVKDQTCELNGKAMQSDPMGAMRNRMRIMKELAFLIDPKIQVEGSMIFIHQESEVVLDRQEKFTVVLRHQLNRHIRDMRNKYHFQSIRQVDTYYQAIQKYHSPYPVKLPIVSDQDWIRVKKGCRCPRCNSYRLEFGHKKARCIDCHHKINKSDLVTDLYCQLCVLMHHQEKAITVKRLTDFSDNKLSKSTIYKSLAPYNIHQNKSRYSYFINHKLPRKKHNHIFVMHQN